MAYIKIDDTNRITAASYDYHCGDEEIETSIPEDMQLENIHDYLYINGEYVYDPLPEPEPIVEEPTADELLNAISRGLGYE